MPRTPTVMSSARLLVVRRAFLVLDARWTMAKKHSPTSSLFPHHVPSLSLFLFRVLCRSTGNFSRSGNPSVWSFTTPVCWLSWWHEKAKRRRWKRRRRKRRSKRAVEEEDERTTRKRKPPECPPLTFLLFLRAGSFSFSTRKKRRVGGAGTHVERTKVTREVRFET